ncbi:hypothetical protein BDW02DRAFT_610164 [Decorospora gaudefroyi]|uniref:Uncharacterized protein n=1 Tax=Decorospora gaudefroyi TaxID=184978 RepID=A0A6A5K1C5_9PLEO|nr:hypothetical protein BDW02DRAFT_610164 [Decorospora gaudefroyi]
MSPYQQLFSTNAVLSVFRNLRNTKDHNDLLLTFQYHQDDVRGQRGQKYGKSGITEATSEVPVSDGRAVDVGGKSIGFVRLTDLSPTLQSSLTQNPLIQIRHLAAGLSRQMSKIELQMADNAPFANGKNLYTGSEIAQRFLPPIQTLFEQRPIPQRMIFELLMELKDLVYMGMVGSSKEVLEWEVDGAAIGALEEIDDAIVRAVTPVVPAVESSQRKELETGHKRHLKRKPSNLISASLTSQQPVSFLLAAPEELLYSLESLKTTALASTHLPLPIPDLCAHAIITLRRLAPRQTLSEFSQQKKRRVGRCAEYARCMKWAGTHWRQNGGCRRGCKNEDEDPENLPSWHRSSRWFDERGSGTFMVGGGRAMVRDDGFGVVKMAAS